MFRTSILHRAVLFAKGIVPGKSLFQQGTPKGVSQQILTADRNPGRTLRAHRFFTKQTPGSNQSDLRQRLRQLGQIHSSFQSGGF
jgi:hypothetical protein